MSRSIEQLLLANDTVQAQYDSTIDNQLEDLYSRIAQELMQIRQMEDVFLEQRSQLLKQIHPFLENDARSLLPTPQFRNFLEELLHTYKFSSRVVRQAPIFSIETTTWLLQRLNAPLQLRQCEVIRNRAYEALRLTASLSSWNQTVTVTIVHLLTESRELDFPGSDDQWNEILAQMQSGDFSSHRMGQERMLAQEISCLLCYIGSLLELTPKMRWFTYP